MLNSNNSTLFYCRGIYQGDGRLSYLSRWRQCSFMSFSALLCAQFRPVGEWRRSTVDDILVEDDKMYLNAIESRAILDEQTISLKYLPNTICSPFLSDGSSVSN